MTHPLIEERPLHTGLFQFIFPFSLNENCQKQLKLQLVKDGFDRFALENLELETAYYGPEHRVSHHRLERYFLPFTNNMLFPRKPGEHAFYRFSAALARSCRFTSKFQDITLHIHSVDVFLCPFDVGFITVRAELPCEGLTLTDALEFAGRFRVLQNIGTEDHGAAVQAGDLTYEEVEDFIFNELVPGMLPFLDKSELKQSYFEKLPFFVDERMYVQVLLGIAGEEEITPGQRYRASRMDGMDAEGRPYMSSTSTDYIRRYCEKHEYDRWAPDTYYMIEETSFVCLTRLPGSSMKPLVSHLYGEYYYSLLLNLFQKIVLLKLSNRYSHVQLDRDPDEIEELIRHITTFSAKSYFLEAVTQSQGKEIFGRLRSCLGSDGLYADVKQTLADLFKYQGNFTSRRSNYLLLILTIYTVISGIYGMNQVIEDLKGPIDWGKLGDYSPFEWLAFVVTFSGIAVAFGLGLHTLFRLLYEFWKNRKKT